MTQLKDAGPTSGSSPRRPRSRRRWRRAVLICVLSVALVLVIATVGIGYYFSSVLVVVDNSTEYPLTIRAVNGNEVTLDRTEDTERPVILGLNWPDGSAILSGATRVTGDAVVRTVSVVVKGTLVPGAHADVDVRVYDGDPKTARGLDFQSVTVPSELGDLPAWLVPPTATSSSNTWVIAVHGLGATRREALRALPALAEGGLPTLVLGYRNDVGAPSSPDGYYHLGDTEWRDVASAVEYAGAHGARGVVLYGWSMGGALVMTAMRRMGPADVALVRGLVLDSANFDWNAILDLQASRRGLPAFVTWTAKRFIEWRADLSLADFDRCPYASRLQVPALCLRDRIRTSSSS